jgi:hypothetical protein
LITSSCPSEYISHALKEDELSALVLFTAVLKEVPHYVGPFLPLLLLHVFALCAPSVESRIRRVGGELLQVLLECLCGRPILKIIQPDIEKIMSNVPKIDETKDTRMTELKDLGAPIAQESGLAPADSDHEHHEHHEHHHPHDDDGDGAESEGLDDRKLNPDKHEHVRSRVRMSTLCGWKREDIKSIVQSLAVARSKLEEDLKNLCFVWMVETRDASLEWLSFRMHVALFDHLSTRSVSRLAMVVLNVSERQQHADKEGAIMEWKHLMMEEIIQTVENVPDDVCTLPFKPTIAIAIRSPIC